MAKIYVVFDESTEGGAICEGEENSSWPSHEDNYVHVTFKALYRNPPTDRFFYDSFEVADELLQENALHLAVVRYFSGGTFGNTCGYFYIVGAFKTSTDAEVAIKKTLESKDPVNYPWNGYFSGYEDDEIHVLNVFDS